MEMKYIDIASAQQFVWWAVARKWDVTQCDIDSWSHHQHLKHHQNNHSHFIIIIIFDIIYRSSSSLYLGNEMSPHVIYTLSSSATLQLNLDRNHLNNKVKKYITLMIWVWLITSSQKIWWWWSWLWIHLVERVLWKLSCWHGQSFGTGPLCHFNGYQRPTFIWPLYHEIQHLFLSKCTGNRFTGHNSWYVLLFESNATIQRQPRTIENQPNVLPYLDV